MKYLIIAEVNKTGFITEFKNTFEEADDYCNELFFSLTNITAHKMETIAHVLKQRGYISYKIKGNALYFGKCRSSTTNGEFTVSVAEVDLRTFCLQKMLKERENHSIVFEYEQLNDEFIDKFPSIDLIAN